MGALPDVDLEAGDKVWAPNLYPTLHPRMRIRMQFAA
jgi:hypothetical protein